MQTTFDFYNNMPMDPPEIWPRPGMTPEYLHVPTLAEIDESLKPYDECRDALEKIQPLRVKVNAYNGSFTAVKAPDLWEINSAYFQEVLIPSGTLFHLPFSYGYLEEYGIWHESFKPFMEGGVVEFWNNRPCLKVEKNSYGGRGDERRITRDDIKELSAQLCEIERAIIMKYTADILAHFFKARAENRPIKAREHYGSTYLSYPSHHDCARNAANLLTFIRYMSHSDKGAAPTNEAADAMKDGGEWRTEWFTATAQANGRANVSLTKEAVTLLNELREKYYTEYLNMLHKNN